MSAMNMCIGEKKKAFIPHKFGFGAVHVKNIFKYLSLNSKIKRSDKEPSKYYIRQQRNGWASLKKLPLPVLLTFNIVFMVIEHLITY